MRIRKFKRNTIWRIGVVFFILLCIASVIQTEVVASQNSRITACQYSINQQFLSVIKVRSALSDNRTNIIDNFIISVFTAKSQADALADYKNYQTELATLDAQEAKLSYPSFKECS